MLGSEMSIVEDPICFQSSVVQDYASRSVESDQSEVTTWLGGRCNWNVCGGKFTVSGIVKCLCGSPSFVISSEGEVSCWCPKGSRVVQARYNSGASMHRNQSRFVYRFFGMPDDCKPLLDDMKRTRYLPSGDAMRAGQYDVALHFSLRSRCTVLARKSVIRPKEAFRLSGNDGSRRRSFEDEMMPYLAVSGPSIVLYHHCRVRCRVAQLARLVLRDCWCLHLKSEPTIADVLNGRRRCTWMRSSEWHELMRRLAPCHRSTQVALLSMFCM